MKPLELALLVGAWWLFLRSAPSSGTTSGSNYVYPQPQPAPDSWKPLTFGEDTPGGYSLGPEV